MRAGQGERGRKVKVIVTLRIQKIAGYLFFSTNTINGESNT